MDDLTVQNMKVKDDTRLLPRDNTVIKERVYTFYLGKHGPFTERVPLENFDAGEINRRIDTLTMHLRQIPG